MKHTYALKAVASELELFPATSSSSFEALSEFRGLPFEPCELLREFPSNAGDSDSDVPAEFGPESERLKNFLLGVMGVPSPESLSLDSKLEIIGCMRFGEPSFSGVCGNVGHS